MTMNYADITPPEWCRCEIEVFNRINETGQPQKYEKEYIRKDGLRIPVELFMHRISDEQGRTKFYYACVIDNSERSKLLQQLHDERKKAGDLARCLKDKNDVLEAIMENTDAQLAYLDRDFNFVNVNSSYVNGSQHSREELLAANHFDIFPNIENQAIFERARDTGEVIEYREKPFEFAGQPARGTTYWNWRLTPVTNRSETQGLVLSLVDVTESKRAKLFSETLNNINSRINAAVKFEEVAPIIIEEAALRMECQFASLVLRNGNSWRQKYINGFPEKALDMLLNKSATPICNLCYQTKKSVIVSDMTQEKLWSGITEQFGIKAVMAVPIIVKDEVCGVLTFNYCTPRNFTPMFIDFAYNLGVILSMGLENERLYGEKDYLAKKLERIMETLAEGIIIVGNDSIIQYVNIAGEQILGLGRDQLIGKRYLELPFKLTRLGELGKDPLTKMINEGHSVYNNKYAMERTDGSTKILSLNIAPFRDERNAITGKTVSFADITESYHIEEKIKHQNIRLEEMVNKRTEWLRNTNKILRLSTEKNSRKEYLDALVEVLQKLSGCSNVGIRIKDEDSMAPYESTIGFQRAFVLAEHLLSIENDQCACSRVLRKKPGDLDAPMTNEAGSFVCTDTSQLVDNLATDEFTRLKGVCMLHGFGSMALIPIYRRGVVIGLIHLADEQKEAISENCVEFIESVAPLIGDAINRFYMEDTIRRNYEVELANNSLLNLSHQEISFTELVDRAINIINSISWIPRKLQRRLLACQKLVYSISTFIRMTEKMRVEIWQMDKPSMVRVLIPIMETFDVVIKRKLALEQLSSSEERFSTAFRASPYPMSIVTIKDGVYVDVNDKFLSFSGYSKHELIGRKSLDVGFWTDKAKHYDCVERLSQKKGVQNMELMCQTKDGQLRTCLFSGEAIEIAGEKCMLSIFNDITERLNMEKEIARLDRLNLVGEMAAGIGHEIRNPMTAARGFLQLLGGKEDCQKYKEYYDLIIEELDRANSIITEFLSMAKNRSVDLELINVNSIVKAIFALIQADATLFNKNVHIDLGQIPDLMLDEKEIRQMLLNLARNGLEAMNDGGTLTIRTYLESSNVVLAVTDEGTGIPQQVLSKIGTPFFTTKDQGTGLGVAICYSIAARHNASINIKTGPGGTTFYVKFPTNVKKM